MYQKTIIITHDKRYERAINNMLRSKNLAVETDIPLLSDFESIRNDIIHNTNTINIRGEFEYFIKEYGLPYMFIIEYQMELGIPGKLEIENTKLLKTFILAYAILAQAKGFDNGSANIVLIVERKHESTAQQFAKYPLFLLDQIRTKDERINAIIDAFGSDQEKVKNFFRMSYILRPTDGNYARELDRLQKIMPVYDKIISQQRTKEPDVKTKIVSEDLEPADVVCRATLEKIIINGELSPITDEQKKTYIEKNIHLLGAVVQKTNLKVQERLLNTFTTMTKINPFKKGERIFIQIPDSTLIDGSFASSMGKFLSTVLEEYSGISINIEKGYDDFLKVVEHDIKLNPKLQEARLAKAFSLMMKMPRN